MKLSDALIIGAPMQGGFFAGTFQVDGQRYGLVLSPKAGDFERAVWRSSDSDVVGSDSFCDGAVNTVAMVDAECPHALAAAALEIGGFKDWYIPSRDELELLYRHFKPTAKTNYVYRSGDNPSSLPPGYPYTAELPAQASAPEFKEGGAEAFEDAWYWSSTQYSRDSAWAQGFGGGCQDDGGKSYEGRARAVRRFKVE